MTNPLNGKLSPEDAIPKALNCYKFKKSTFFNVDGHLYTTFKIAKLAGQQEDISLILAYFSQYPDLDPKLNAVQNWLNLIDIEWRNLLAAKLHSLHGGNATAIAERKKVLDSSIRNYLSNNEYWKAGILIHSLGDAYAHTKKELNSSGEEAYGLLVGHGVDSVIGNNPDDINRKIVREKYIAFIKHLYSILKTNEANDEDLEKFLEEVDIDQCTLKICPAFQPLNLKDSSVEIFINCINKDMRNLTKDEITDIFKSI